MAKFEQMITQDEYDACIKGYQIIDCVARNKDYFHFVGRNVKEEGAMSERKVAKRATLFMATYLDALVQADVPFENLRLRGQSIGRRRRDADGGHARRGLAARSGS